MTLKVVSISDALRGSTGLAGPEKRYGLIPDPDDGEKTSSQTARTATAATRAETAVQRRAIEVAGL
jgi:hypothetical protein